MDLATVPSPSPQPPPHVAKCHYWLFNLVTKSFSKKTILSSVGGIRTQRLSDLPPNWSLIVSVWATQGLGLARSTKSYAWYRCHMNEPLMLCKRQLYNGSKAIGQKAQTGFYSEQKFSAVNLFYISVTDLSGRQVGLHPHEFWLEIDVRWDEEK